MSTATAPFTIVYECQCPELRRRCPACIAHNPKPKLSKPKDPEAKSVGRPKASLPPRLVAAHAELVARIAAEEPYAAMGERYGVSEYMLIQYIERTGIYVPRAALKAEKFRILAPQILAEWAAGELLSVLAQKYKISTHAIRCLKHRAEAAQCHENGT